MRRRILVVASWYPSEGSRIGSFVKDQVRALARVHDVAVIAPRIRRFRHRLLGRGSGPPRAVVEDGSPVSRPQVVPPLPFARRLLLDAYERSVARAWDELRESWGRADLIHAHVALPAGWAAAGLARRSGVPLVLTEHSAPFDANLRTGDDRRRTREALLEASRVIAVGPALADTIRRFEPTARLSVVGNVIDTDFWSPASPGSGRPGRRPCQAPLRVVTVGGLTPQKGIDLLLLAAAAAEVADGPGVELVIVGEGPESDRLHELARGLGLADRCRFVGAAEPAGVREWLRWADVFVLASRWESFSVATGEAIACGTPVVVTESGGPEEFVTAASGRTVAVGDVAGLARAMVEVGCRRVAVDPVLARDELRDRFSVEAFLRQIDAVYDAALTEGR